MRDRACRARERNVDGEGGQQWAWIEFRQSLGTDEEDI